MTEMTELGLKCRGVIFQYNSEGVLFEFPDGSSDDAIGLVKASDIRMSNGDYIPADANTTELLSKYLQAGDEIICTAVKKDDLPMYSYAEEEEEIDEGGEVKSTLKTVEIQPQWIATSAELLGSSGVPVEEEKNAETKKDVVDETVAKEEESNATKVANFDDDEVGVLEEQLGDMFDYEDDVVFLEDVDIPDEDNGTSSATQKKSTPIPATSSAKPETKKISDKKDAIIEEEETVVESDPKEQATQENTSVDETLATKAITKVQAPPKEVAVVTEEIFTDTARIVQLKRPSKGNNETSKVVTGIFEILSGKFSKRRVTVSNASMYVWGHHLDKANLMFHLKYGDECTIEYRVAEIKASEDTPPEEGAQTNSLVKTPIVKTLWFGDKNSAPATLADNPNFSLWLTHHSIDEKDFQKWIKNQVPNRPFFPYPSDIFSCKVIGYVREDKFFAQGVFLEIEDMIRKIDDTDKPKEAVEVVPPGTEDAEDPAVKFEEQEQQKIDQPDVTGKEKKHSEITWKDPPASDSRQIAILMQDDFFVCGVTVGSADLRFLLRPDDIVSCQIQAITNADKRRLKKELSQMPELTVTHIAYLGYVGPKRPKQANLAPAYAPFIDKYLKTKGLTMEEFEAMRSPNVERAAGEVNGQFNQPPPSTGAQGQFMSPFSGPPVGFMGPRGPFLGPRGPMMGFGGPPVGFGPPGSFGPPGPPVNMASVIATRAVNLLSPEDPKVRTFFQFPQEIEIAAKITKILTQALIHEMKGNIQSKMNSNLPTVSDLVAQNLQVRTAEQVLLKVGEGASAPSLQDQLKEVEDRLAKEAEAAKAAANEANKAKPIVRDAKKMLESYKAAKAATEKKEMMPLEYLREYGLNKKKITTDKTTIWFGDVGFPKTTRTNYKTIIGKDNYYTLSTLYHFLSYNPNIAQYQAYFRAAQSVGVSPVLKADLEDVHQYLTNKSFPKPKNVESISHKDLNPQLFISEKVAEWKDKYLGGKRAGSVPAANNSSKLSRMDDDELKAQAQIQLLAQSQQHQQQAPVKEKRQSRFDQAVHPTKGFSQMPPTNPPLGPIPITNTNPFDIAPSMQQQQPFSQQLQPIPFGQPQFGQALNPFGPSIEQQLMLQQQQQLQQQQLIQQQQQQTNMQFLQQQQWHQQQQQQLIGQPSDPFSRNNVFDPLGQQQQQQTSASDGFHQMDLERERGRGNQDYNRRSPTFERMQEVRPRSPTFRSRSPSVRDGGKRNADYDPFNPTESPPPRMEDPYRQAEIDARAERDRQLQVEMEQQRLWEEFKRERDAKKKKEDELEALRMREAEIERIRIREEELEKLRIREEELKLIRLREEELEKLRIREEELKLIRLREEELEKLRQKKEEEARSLRRREEDEKKRKQEEDEKRKREEEEKRLWTLEMEKRLRAQNQTDEWERRLRQPEVRQPPPPPKIDGYSKAPLAAPAKPKNQIIVELSSDEEDNTMPLRSSFVSDKKVPPPPKLSGYGGSSLGSRPPVKSPWATDPAETSYDGAARKRQDDFANQQKSSYGDNGSQPSWNRDRDESVRGSSMMELKEKSRMFQQQQRPNNDQAFASDRGFNPYANQGRDQQQQEQHGGNATPWEQRGPAASNNSPYNSGYDRRF